MNDAAAAMITRTLDEALKLLNLRTKDLQTGVVSPVDVLALELASTMSLDNAAKIAQAVTATLVGLNEILVTQQPNPAPGQYRVVYNVNYSYHGLHAHTTPAQLRDARVRGTTLIEKASGTISQLLDTSTPHLART